MTGLPYLEMDEVAALLGYKNRRAAIRAIKNKLFEVPFYTLAGKPVVNTAVLHKFFEEKTNEGQLTIELMETGEGLSDAELGDIK